MENNQKSRSVGLHSNSESHIQQLRDILDRYSSQDIIREIVQNADDAGASELAFFVLEEGISSAHPDTHPLLKNSALLIFNNAPLKKEDTEGITLIIKGTKQEDSTKIGRFGLGLKSLFHVCEGFFFGPYRSPDKTIEAQLFDPWCDIRCNYADKLPQWTARQVNNALNTILTHLENFLGASYKDNFFMYIPFRDNDISKLMLKKLKITASGFINDARIYASLQQLPLSLAQCSFLKKVSFFIANSLSELAEHESLYEFSIQRKKCLRRPQKEKKGVAEQFVCSVSVSKQGVQDSVWECLGINRFAPNHDGLQKLHADIRWPVVNLAGDPEKSLPNAAITILHNKDSDDKRLSLRWASFLPLDDRKTEDNSNNDLVQTIREPYLQGAWEILLHGYFFLSSDRKHIFGITKTGEEDIKQQWNRLLVQQLLLPLFPRILLMKIEEEPKNAKIIDAVRLWNRFDEFREDMTSSCFLVKIATNNAWEIHTEALYMLPEGIPPSLKGWLEREFPQPVALEGKGIYSSQRHTKQWDEDSFSQICLHFPATPEELAESDIFWIQKFIRDIKEENRYRKHLRKWLLRALQNRLFDSKNEKVRSALYPFAEDVFQNEIWYMPMKTEPILRSIARDRPELLSPCLLLPRAEDNTAPPSSQTLPESISDEQRIALLRFLGEEKLNDREKQPEGSILLSDRLIAGRQIPELDALPFYRVSIFLQGKQKEEAARSFQELQQQKERNCLFKQPAPGSGISNTLKQLSLVLEDAEIWLLRTEATLELSLTTWEATLFEALTTNKLSSNEKIHRELFKDILKKLFAENKENSLCIQALRNLLAGKHVDKYVKFVLYSETRPTVHERWSHKYIFIYKDDYRYLSEEHKKALAIVEEHSIASEQLRDILSDAAPWQFWQDMLPLCRNPKKDIPDELEDIFKTACWIPAAQGGGLAPSHILGDDIPTILKKALPSSWICREKLSADLEQLCSEDQRLWIMKVLDALYPEQELRRRQLMELFQDEDFHTPCNFFPPQLDDLAAVAQHLRPLADSMTKEGPEECLLSLLLSLPEIPSAALQKFQSVPSKFNHKICRYDILLHAAPTYAQTHIFTPLLPSYAQYLAAARQHDEKLFERDYLFPTRTEKVWKKGHEITEAQRGREDSAHLDETVWEACSSFFSSDSKYPSDKGRSSAQYLEKYFSVPFAKPEKYRVACFLRLIAGKNKDIRALAKKFSSNISNELTNIFGFDFGDTCWDFLISAEPSDQERSLAGYPFAGNKRTLFTYTPQKNKVYFLYFYQNKAGKPAENQEDFTERLKLSIFEWLKQFDIETKIISDIINKFSPTQYSLHATTALLRDNLRTVIEQLHIRDFELKEKQIAIWRNIQQHNGVNVEKLKSIEKLKKELWDIAQDKNEIYKALLEKIQNYGYREEGVLLELIQNADDALRERSEPKKRSVTITLHNRILSFSHYGRPINEKNEGEASANNDLYSMLMLNRSEKESHSATGKLGLGFKSVFLLSEQPVIQSKALCFSIRNGMFPQEETMRLDQDDEITLFRLLIKREIPDEEMERRIFSRVLSAAVLIPVFAHEIREFVININGDEETFAYNPDASDRGQGWIADYNAHVLCFSDPDSGIQLAIRLDAHNKPTLFPDTMPPLWHTLPTVSGLDWRLGYAINGPFSLNAGRSNIAPIKKDFDNLEAFGVFLGESLCNYAQFVKKNYPDAIAAHNHALWMVLSRGLESPEDSLQGKIVRSLHADGRGLSYWLTQQSVPCGIPEEWAWPLEGIPPKWHTCSFPSDNARQNFSQTVQQLHKEHFTGSLARFAYVPSEQKARLEALGFPVEHMKTADFFAEFFARLVPDKRLTPHLLSCLRQIREELPRQDFPFRVRTQAGTWEDIQQVLLPPNTPCELSSDFRGEQRRAAFAPPHALLSEEYVSDREDAEIYRRLRNGHTVTSDILQGWITELESPEQRIHALRYLEERELGHELLISFRSEQQGWIRDFSLVSELLDSMPESEEAHKHILMDLFPDAFSLRTDKEIDEYESEEGEEYEEDTPVLAISNRSQWEAMLDFWDKNKILIIDEYIYKTWPDQFRDQALLKERLEKNDRCAWLVLLLLGYLQSIGRSKPEMHRTFVQELLTKHKKLFTDRVDKDDPQWLFPLSAWHDANISTNTYAMWMTCFPALHQLGRFLKQYQNILGSMIRGKLERKQLLDCFSPRSAYTFQQAGTQFDAPPFPLRLGKYWVLRELARLNFKSCQTTSGEAFLECCWVPRKRCCDILDMDYIEDTDARQEELVSTLLELNKTLPHFDYCFDIALCAMRK